MKKIVLRLTGLYLNLLALFSPRLAGQKGFELFCSPQKVPLKKHQLDYLNTGESFTFQSEGVRIQGFKWGSGSKKILFIHGWQSHSFRWKNYIESFSKEEYTLYAFDAPAHGQSGGKFLNLPVYSQAIERFFHE